MKDQQIYSSFYLSVGFHSLFFIAVIAYMLIAGASRQAPTMMVSLVESPLRGSGPVAEPAPSMPAETQAAKESEPAEPETKPAMAQKTEPKAAHTAKDRIAAMQAKRQAVRSATLRRQLNISKTSSSVAGAGGNGTPGGGTYDSVIGSIIQKNWATADFLNRYRSLNAIITIRISRDGSVTILGWEKKSGNSLFDREALRAVTRSSPLPPPPSEIERSINFDPQKGR
jgi:TonB family protein